MSKDKQKNHKYAFYRQFAMLFFLLVSLFSGLSLYFNKASDTETVVTLYQFQHGDIFGDDVTASPQVQYHPTNHQLILNQLDSQIWFPQVHYHHLSFMIDIGSLDEAIPLIGSGDIPTFVLTWGAQEKNITVSRCDVYKVDFESPADAPLILTYRQPAMLGPSWGYVRVGVKTIKMIGQIAK